jgi:hypothetical protein
MCTPDLHRWQGCPGYVPASPPFSGVWKMIHSRMRIHRDAGMIHGASIRQKRAFRTWYPNQANRQRIRSAVRWRQGLFWIVFVLLFYIF